MALETGGRIMSYIDGLEKAKAIINQAYTTIPTTDCPVIVFKEIMDEIDQEIKTELDNMEKNFLNE